MQTFMRTSVLLLVLTTVSAHAMHWLCCGCCGKNNKKLLFGPMLVNSPARFIYQASFLVKLDAGPNLYYDRNIHFLISKISEESNTIKYLQDLTQIILQLCAINQNKKKKKPLKLIWIESLTETIDFVCQHKQNLKKKSKSIHNFFHAIEKLLPYYKPNEMLRSEENFGKLPETENIFLYHPNSPTSSPTKLVREYKKTEKEYGRLKTSLTKGLKHWTN